MKRFAKHIFDQLTLEAWVVVATALVLVVASQLFANTPGKHTVALTWTAAQSGPPATSYNIYRGAATGVCSGNPQPYATVQAPQVNYTDPTPLPTDFYAISAVGSGGESACTPEVQVQVPNVTQGTPGNPGAQVQ